MIDGRFPEFGLKIVTRLDQQIQSDAWEFPAPSWGCFFHYGLLEKAGCVIFSCDGSLVAAAGRMSLYVCNI